MKSKSTASNVLPSQPRNAASIERFRDEFDVIVVGFGVAGGAAAIEAARAGARTLILERATRGGGATALSEGTIYFGGGTRVQKATGFEDTFDNMLAHVRAAAGRGQAVCQTEARLARRCVGVSPLL